MNKILKFERFLSRLEMYAALLSGLIVGGMILLVTADVIMRTLFTKPIQGTYDVVRFLFIGAVFLAVPYVQGLKENIKIEIVTNKLSRRVNHYFSVLGYVIAIIVVFILVWRTGLEAWRTLIINEYSMGLVRVPLWPAKSIISVGLSLLFIRLFVDLLVECGSLRK